MLLGKRPRHQMKRTSSETGIAVDVEPLEDGVLHIAAGLNTVTPPNYIPITTSLSNTARNVGVGPYYHDQNYSATAALVSPRRNPHGANKCMETPQFLRICRLCQRRLVPGRDIYMYRGDTAFCSVECREELIKQEGRK